MSIFRFFSISIRIRIVFVHKTALYFMVVIEKYKQQEKKSEELFGLEETGAIYKFLFFLVFCLFMIA